MTLDQAASPGEPRILMLGDTALSVDFGNLIDADINGRVIALDRALQGLHIAGVIETVPTYRALTVHVDPIGIDWAQLRHVLHDLARTVIAKTDKPRRWHVPVTFGGVFGIDLDSIAAHAGLTSADFVEAYCSAVYTTYMIGFLPGFSYLGGLDPKLAMPRRPQPRLKIPASSISIGGLQTAIGSVEGPSGWHLIGRTPVRPFMRERVPVFLFQPGDEVVFLPLSAAEFERLEAAAAQGERIAQEVDP